MIDRNVTIGLVQMSCGEEKNENLEKALRGVAEATKKGAQIVALPELFSSRYFCQSKDDARAYASAEESMGITTKTLADAAAKHGITLIGGSFFERGTDGKYYNTSHVFSPNGTILGTYRKMHIPEDILYHEQHYFARGEEGYNVVDTPHGRISVLICYDQWFPEAARIATLKGAEIIVYPTAIGTIDGTVEENITGDWQKMWTNVQLGHAAANNVFVCGINRTGREGAITFWGGSFIADPASTIVAQGGAKEEVLIAQCDLSRVKALQKAWRFLECRRPETYGPLTDR